AAVERVRDLGQAVDVLHHVQLTDAGPVGGRGGAGVRAQRPERRPVTDAGARVGLLDGRGDLQLAAGRRGEVGALGLHPAGGPVAGRVADRLDHQVTVAVLVDVAGAVGHRLDLAGAPVRGTTG